MMSSPTPGANCRSDRAARIGHRSLRPDHILVDPSERVWLIGWESAEAGTNAAEKDADVAELAVALASRVGAGRAVQTAVDALGAERVSACLSHCQPLALAAPIRRMEGSGQVLADLRHEVAAIDGREAPGRAVAGTHGVPAWRR